jgi:lysine 2,3-aminomutase
MKKEYKKVDWKSVPLFKDVTEAQWNDYKWQLKNVVKDIDTLQKIVDLDDVEIAHLRESLTKFRMAITPYYASLMDKHDRNCPVRLQAVPRLAELNDDPSDLDDPLHEDVDSPSHGLTHRYPDRVLLLVTNICSMNCRHCTRRRIVGFDDQHMSREDVDKSIEYIAAHPYVRDVLISGGDPLVLNDDQLEYIIKKLRAIEHVEIIRIGTRTPVVMPQRITENLCNMLKKYHPIYVNTHYNHPKEITDEARVACARLADAGIQLGNQSVLLRTINDCPCTMKRLVHELLMIRVKPYYIYQCDLSKGISHFRTTISRGLEIIENLRGHTTGFAVPTFVVDAPGGGGKIPVMPQYLVSYSDKRAVLRNYEGVLTTYTHPEPTIEKEPHSCEFCRDERYKPLDGVAKLLSGEKLVLQPADLVRKKRIND